MEDLDPRETWNPQAGGGRSPCKAVSRRGEFPAIREKNREFSKNVRFEPNCRVK